LPDAAGPQTTRTVGCRGTELAVISECGNRFRCEKSFDVKRG
jgi:hypothetical protein